MIRGTTPTIKFNIDAPTENIENLEIYFADGDKLILEKNLSDLTISEKVVSLTLSQEDSLKLAENTFIKVQIRILYSDGSVIASNVMKCFVDEILKDGEIVGSKV